MEDENKPVYIDVSDSSNGSVPDSNQNHLVTTPVDGGSSGKGLPYAPEGWPNPGDVWTWKVGKRATISGHWLDKALYPPKHLKNLPSVFNSRTSLAQSIRKEYPQADIGAFFASFTWRIPAAGHIQRETRRGYSDINGRVKSEAAIQRGDCKAGNSMCSVKGNERISGLLSRSCDICCSETGFCHDCCCILCCKTIDWTYGGYSFVRCEAMVDDKLICGHVAHIDCALRAYLAGKVGGCINLDAQYFCRCCDNKTDLLNHVIDLIKTCESIDSRDDIEKILNMCFCILHGSEQERAKDLQNRVALIMAKGFQTNSITVCHLIQLKHGFPLDDIWREESTPEAGYEVTMLGAPEAANDLAVSVSSMNETEPMHEDSEDNEASGNAGSELFIASDHTNLSMKLEDEIERVLRELKRSQSSDYQMAEQKLHAQRDLLLSLYQQLEAERSALASGKSVLDKVLDRVDQIKHEEAMLKEIMKAAKGFGGTLERALSNQFDP